MDGNLETVEREMTNIKPFVASTEEATENENHPEESSKTDEGKCLMKRGESSSLRELEEVLFSAPRSCRHGDEVWPKLFLGDMFMSHNRFLLWQMGISHVLNAAHGKPSCQGDEGFYGASIKYFGVPANDLPTFDLSPFFYPAADFIHQGLTSGGQVFVHCAVGVSRSAALILAYLMIYHQFTLLSSIRCVQQKRWIFPNRGFLRQLLKLEQKLKENGP